MNYICNHRHEYELTSRKSETDSSLHRGEFLLIQMHHVIKYSTEL